MKINLVSLTMFSGGALLVYCGVKGYDPRDVVSWALGGKKPKTFKQKKDEGENYKPKVPKEGGQSHPGDKFYPPGTEDGGEPTVPTVFV